MSSANFFTGYSNDKPTSRVMAPPGGRCNNIFGGYEDEPAKSKSQQENIRPISNIFAAPEDTSAKNANKPDRMKSNLFGDDQTKASNNAQNKKRNGINPITGRAYHDEDQEEERKKAEEPQSKPKSSVKQEEEEAVKSEKAPERKIHTSSKVLQPPGGKSSKLW